MAKHTFDDHGDLRKYFAAIPNLVFTLGLGPYELALYAHFKQAAGDNGGVCWKSRATISREAGMSAGMVTKARVALEKRRPELGGKPLVLVREETSKTGGKPTCQITITDIWPENMAKYSTSYSDGEADSTSPGDEQRHTVTLATSPHAHKEKLLKKNSEEERDSPHSRLMNFHYQRIGKIPDPKAQGSAVKWLLETCTPEQAIDCYRSQLAERWRNGYVTWLTVKQGIGAYLAGKNGGNQGRSYVETELARCASPEQIRAMRDGR